MTIISTTVAVAFFLVPKNVLASTEISSDVVESTTWTKANSPYVVTKSIQVKAPLTIEAGTVIKFGNGDEEGPSPGLSIKSSFKAVGNVLEKIVFTSACDSSFGGETLEHCSVYSRGKPMSGDWSGIGVIPMHDTPVLIEHATILYAYTGVGYDNYIKPNEIFKDLSIKHTEIKYCFSDGIFLRYTQPTMDGLVLSGNYNGVEIYASSYWDMAKIRNSVISGNRNGIYSSLSYAFDARYNYWGDPSGPYRSYGTSQDNKDGKGNRLVGTSTLFRPWNQSDPTVPKEPVIFVPGIGASLNPDLMIGNIFADNWMMFDHTYDGILEAFKVMGYQEGKNFFIAYYDWRQSNVESAEEYLKPIIKKALEKSDAEKVNIVTHSMGSLVARSYVQSDSYASDVDNLIMIAPPNKGSSDVYAAWEGGRIPSNWDGKFIMKVYLGYLTNTTLETASFYDTIHKYIPSLRDLMPTYDFLHTVDDAQNLKNFLSMKEKNNFLLDLNSDIDKLDSRTRLSIILGDKQPTVNKIPTINSDKNDVWADGKPDPIDPNQDDTEGDGEVLISSGDTPSDFRDVLEYGHREIVSKSEKIVAERLGESLDGIYNSPTIDDEMIFWTDAPAEMEVSDPDGNIISKDKNNIENGIYSQEKLRDGFKIASVPNAKKGEYKVSLKGNVDSHEKHHVAVEYFDHTGNKENKSTTQLVEIKKDQTQNLVIVADPENNITPIENIQLKDEVEPIVTISSPADGAIYTNDQILPISFSFSDNVSKPENIKTEMYLDEEELFEKTIDLSKLSSGREYTVWVAALDEAGNYGWGEASFKVKKSDPPVVTVPDPPTIPPVIPTDPLPVADPPPVVIPDSDPISDTDTPPVVVTDPPIVADPSPTVDPPVVIVPDPVPVVAPPVVVAVDIPIQSNNPPPAIPPIVVQNQMNVAQEKTDNNDDERSSKKDKKHKKKSHKKSHPKKATIVLKNGVTKSKEEIKTISSSKSLPLPLRNNQEVLGVMTDRSFEENVDIVSDDATNQSRFDFQPEQQRESFADLLARSNGRISAALGKMSFMYVSPKNDKTLSLENGKSNFPENNPKRNWMVATVGLFFSLMLTSFFLRKRI
ncbi:MAG: hypothetical protein PHW24_01450 [Candidatus Moranbacteria bacterium]|nr:hypothetical protein [Candidatus Moranbacteria bacterium]